MKRNICHVTIFILVFIMLFCLLEIIFFDKSNIEYQWYRVQDVDDDIDVLILGNSHAYTSTNAKALSEAWGLNVEIFGGSGQSMVETLTYYETTMKYKHPHYIFLEVFSSSNDTRAALQGKSKGTLINDFDGIQNYKDKLFALSRTLKWGNLSEGMFQLLRPTSMWSRWKLMENKNVKADDAHGYSQRITYATGSLSIEEVMERCQTHSMSGRALTEYNMTALRGFLDSAEKQGIIVVLYKAPTMRGSECAYVRTVFDVGREYENVVLCADFHPSMLKMGLKLEDFYDDGHLNIRGAEKFTYYFASDVSNALGIENDWSDYWGYKGETVEELEDGSFAYLMENYSDETLYRYELLEGSKIIEVQEYSENNTFIADIDVRVSDSYTLYCSMIPAVCLEEGDSCPERIRQSFMKQNSCVID